MEDEKPPLLKTWKNLYILVTVTLIVIVVLLYFFTKHFS